MLRNVANRMRNGLIIRKFSTPNNNIPNNKPGKPDSTAKVFFGIVTLTLTGLVFKFQYDNSVTFRKVVNENLGRLGLPVPKESVKNSLPSSVSPKKEDRTPVVTTNPENTTTAVVSAEVHLPVHGHHHGIHEERTHVPDAEEKDKGIPTTSTTTTTTTSVAKVTKDSESSPPPPPSTPSDVPSSPSTPAAAVVVVDTPAVKPPNKLEIDTKPELGPVTSEVIVDEGVKHDVISNTIEELLSQTAITRRDIELSILKDISTLDAETLRLRLSTLTAEFFERAKWESLRLHQSLKQVEQEITARYKALMAQQRSELEIEAEKANIRILTALQEESKHTHEEDLVRFELQLSEALQAQAKYLKVQTEEELNKQSQSIHTELQEQLTHEVAVLRETHVKTQLEVQQKIEDILSQLKSYSAILDENHSRTVYSAQSHLESAAILALERAFEATVPLTKEVNALKEICHEDDFVVTLLESLPKSAVEGGIPSAIDLRARFNTVRNEVRKNALAPTHAPALVSQAVGSVLANISWAPAGFVPGQGIEETLARANYFLEHDDLKNCLKELGQVEGYSSVLMKDWKTVAENRLAVEELISALRASSSLRHLSYAIAYFE